ncbi:MAG: hypothetical protein ACLUW8_09405 [Subdoligranulum sp.]
MPANVGEDDLLGGMLDDNPYYPTGGRAAPWTKTHSAIPICAKTEEDIAGFHAEEEKQAFLHGDGH